MKALVSRVPPSPPGYPRWGRPHLELVELEQVTVTAASEGGQQTTLLGSPLRARPSGGMRLRRDAHALWRTGATGQGRGCPAGARGGRGSWPTQGATRYPCPYRVLGDSMLSSGSLSSQLPIPTCHLSSSLVLLNRWSFCWNLNVFNVLQQSK